MAALHCLRVAAHAWRLCPGCERQDGISRVTSHRGKVRTGCPITFTSSLELDPTRHGVAAPCRPKPMAAGQACRTFYSHSMAPRAPITVDSGNWHSDACCTNAHESSEDVSDARLHGQAPRISAAVKDPEAKKPTGPQASKRAGSLALLRARGLHKTSQTSYQVPVKFPLQALPHRNAAKLPDRAFLFVDRPIPSRLLKRAV
jgi:hypothetical protein